MNKKIREQLNKVSEFDLSNVPDDAERLILHKKSGIKLMKNNIYIIEADDYILNNINEAYNTNWGNISHLPYKYLKCDIVQILGNNVRVNGIEYDFNNKKDTTNMWSGWLEMKHIKVIEKVM